MSVVFGIGSFTTAYVLTPTGLKTSLSAITANVNSKGRYNSRGISSPCVINIVKTNRLRNAVHMIRKPGDLPQKAIFIAKSQGMRRQKDEILDSRAFAAQEWTHRAQDREL
jgi:hypothetical protein